MREKYDTPAGCVLAVTTAWAEERKRGGSDSPLYLRAGSEFDYIGLAHAPSVRQPLYSSAAAAAARSAQPRSCRVCPVSFRSAN